MTEGYDKILLAYTGGLNSLISMQWLQEEYNAEIITYSADTGQGINWTDVKKEALELKAVRAYVDNLQAEFLSDYVFKALKANAIYEGSYPLATALARPLISKRLIEIARQEDIDVIAHGCTGISNDQVRFEVALKTLSPEIEVLAPVRKLGFVSRSEKIKYARDKGLPVSAENKNIYSIDSNIWGLSVEYGKLEDPEVEPPLETYYWTTPPEKASNETVYITIDFDKGEPVKLNGKMMPAVELVKKLNSLGSSLGIGRIDIIENRIVGIKSREIYEAPGAKILTEAHQQLESLILDRETLHYKRLLREKYADLVYNGLWYSPLREALDAFNKATQKRVCGRVKMKLYKGHSEVVGRKSPYSLYQHDLATYDKNDSFDHKASEGFIKIWGLPTQIYSQVKDEEK